MTTLQQLHEQLDAVDSDHCTRQTDTIYVDTPSYNAGAESSACVVDASGGEAEELLGKIYGRRRDTVHVYKTFLAQLKGVLLEELSTMQPSWDGNRLLDNLREAAVTQSDGGTVDMDKCKYMLLVATVLFCDSDVVDGVKKELRRITHVNGY